MQLSTGFSQWDTPTDAAPVGGTPATDRDHPYGGPPGPDQIITHPDGSQTIKHSDGSMEPVLPMGAAQPPQSQAASRGVGGPGAGGDGERGLGVRWTLFLFVPAAHLQRLPLLVLPSVLFSVLPPVLPPPSPARKLELSYR